MSEKSEKVGRMAEQEGLRKYSQLMSPGGGKRRKIAMEHIQAIAKPDCDRDDGLLSIPSRDNCTL